MSAPKYDHDVILADAKRLAPQCSTITELARFMDMNKRTLQGIISKYVDRGPHESTFRALLALSDATDVDVAEAAVYEQLRYWKSRAKEMEKRLGQGEWFFDTLREVVAVLQSEPVAFPKPYGVPAGKSEHATLLLVSDLHYGLKADNLGVFPEYNSEVAKQAIGEIFVRALSIVEKKSSYMDIQRVVINLAGDLVEHNFLRRGHRGQVDKHVVMQVVELSQFLSQGIQMFAERFPKVYVTGVPGNHGRADPTPGAGDPTESFDWMTFKFIETILARQENIEFFFPTCWYSLIRIFDSLVFTMHGEDIRSWAGIPWYGLSRAIKDLQMMLTYVTKRQLRDLDRKTTMTLGDFLNKLTIPDCVLIGHFHTAIDWDEIGIDAVCNGSLVGGTRYGLKRLRRLSRPCQKLLFFHPEWGLVGDEKVFLHDIVEQQTPTEGELPKVLQVG